MASSTSAPTDTDESSASTDRSDASGALLQERTLSIPESAGRAEAAAIAAAIGAHLRDRAAEATADETPEYCDRWTLCGRFRGRKPPRDVVRGEEWKAAGRARW